MKVLQINVCGNGSTGKIATEISRVMTSHGIENAIAYGRNSIAEDVESIKIGNMADVYMHGGLTLLTDRHGFYSKTVTKEFIKKVVEYAPDIIHLQNLVGYYINLEILFDFLKEFGKPVVWTLHDCWNFTGHCIHFEICGCERWKTGCYDCPQKTTYPFSFFMDNSKKNYEQKKRLFTGLGKAHIVCPSEWLCNLVGESFLSEYPRSIIYNGINTEIFKPTYGDWNKKNNPEGKKLVLGVSNVWTRQKGFQDLIKLADMLPDEYRVVIVGVNEKQKKTLPDKIIAVTRTENQKQLAEIYTAAHCFANPTYEEMLGMVNLEALACGTPVITYRTGGAPECADETCGMVVDKGSVSGLRDAIMNCCFEKENCVKRGASFDSRIRFEEYISLYNSITV